MPPSFSTDLFASPGGKMTFNVNSCKEKDELIYFIEFGGGAVDKGQGPFTITLVDPGSSSPAPCNRETFSSEFVLKCGIRNEILPLTKFRITKSMQLSDLFDPNDILYRKCSWNNAVKLHSVTETSTSEPPKVPGAVIIGGMVPVVSVQKVALSSVHTSWFDLDDEDFSLSDSSVKEIPVKRPFKRCEFTQTERNTIVKYIVHQKAFYELKGVDLWRRMVPEVPCHTWQSLKEHFRKKIFPHLSDYNLDEFTISQIKAGMADKRRVMKKSKPPLQNVRTLQRKRVFKKSESSDGQENSDEEIFAAASNEEDSDSWINAEDSKNESHERPASRRSCRFKRVQDGSSSSPLRKVKTSPKEENHSAVNEESSDSNFSGPSSSLYSKKVRISPRKKRAKVVYTDESSDDDLNSLLSNEKERDTVSESSRKDQQALNFPNDTSHPNVNCGKHLGASPKKTNHAFDTNSTAEADKNSGSKQTLLKPQSSPTSSPKKLRKSPGMNEPVEDTSEESDKSCSYNNRTALRSSSRFKKNLSSVSPLQNVRTSPRKKTNIKPTPFESDVSSDENDVQEEDNSSFCLSASDQEDSEEAVNSFNEPGGLFDDDTSSNISITPSGNKDLDLQTVARTAARTKIIKATLAVKDKNSSDAFTQTDPVNISCEVALSPFGLNHIYVQTDSNFAVDQDELEQIESEPLISVPCSPGSALGENSDTDFDESEDFLTAASHSRDRNSKPPTSPKVSSVMKKTMTKSFSDPVLSHYFQEPRRTKRATASKSHGSGIAELRKVDISGSKPSSYSPERSINAQAAESIEAETEPAMAVVPSSGRRVKYSLKTANNLKDSHLNEKNTSCPKKSSKFSSRRQTVSNTDQYSSDACSPLHPENQKGNVCSTAQERKKLSKDSMERSPSNRNESDSQASSACTRSKARLDQRPKRLLKIIKGSK